MITGTDLKAQLVASERELETAWAHIHRLDGAIQLLKHFIAEGEKIVEAEVEEVVEKS